MPSLAERQHQLIERYRIIEDPQERLAAVTSRGRKWPAPSDAEKIDDNLVPGCVSRIWLIGEMVDGACRFRMDADSPLVKGLAALVCEFYDNASPAEIVESDADPIEILGLSRNLSPTRLNGLGQVRRTIQLFAAREAKRS